MVLFGIISLMALVIIFVVTQNQGIQREFKKVQRAHKLLQSHNKYSLGIVMSMSSQLQYSHQTKLSELKIHGLISQQDHKIVNFILENFQFIIVQCCQYNETVEVAVRKALKGQEVTIENISQFIARQPSEVRVPWCKNSVDGFIAACRNLVSNKAKTQTTPENVVSSNVE